MQQSLAINIVCNYTRLGWMIILEVLYGLAYKNETGLKIRSKYEGMKLPEREDELGDLSEG